MYLFLSKRVKKKQKVTKNKEKKTGPEEKWRKSRQSSEPSELNTNNQTCFNQMNIINNNLVRNYLKMVA